MRIAPERTHGRRCLSPPTELVPFHSRARAPLCVRRYCGLPRNHTESYHTFMWENLFRHVDIQPQNANILDGNASDLEAECQAYEDKITAYGGIQLFLGV